MKFFLIGATLISITRKTDHTKNWDKKSSVVMLLVFGFGYILMVDTRVD